MAAEESIMKTRETLGKLISKHTMKGDYLQKPTFSFLHEIVMEVVRLTTFAHGLYTTEECGAEQLCDEKAKVDYLNKAINTTAFALGEQINVSAKKIVAGLEADKTNAWLQKLHEAATTCTRAKSDEAVRRVLNGETMSTPKEKTTKEEGPPQEAANVLIEEETKQNARTIREEVAELRKVLEDANAQWLRAQDSISGLRNELMASVAGGAKRTLGERLPAAAVLSAGDMAPTTEEEKSEKPDKADACSEDEGGGGPAEQGNSRMDFQKLLREKERKLRILQTEKKEMAAELAAAKQKMQGMEARFAAAELEVQILTAEKQELAAKPATAEEGKEEMEAVVDAVEEAGRETLTTSQRPWEEHGKIFRNIYYGPKGHRGLPVYHEPVTAHEDGGLDETEKEKKLKGHLTFGDRIKLVEEPQTTSGPTWYHVQSLATALEGWVVGEIPNKLINCVDMQKYCQREGRTPKDAYLGQEFPYDAMFTEGFGGKHNICLVSASGDNCWRDINIELLMRDIGTATVFEQDWGGSATFTDWVAFYAFNCAVYGEIGTSKPKRLIVTVKPNVDYKAYPKTDVEPRDVENDIGKAQFKECKWLQANLPKKGFLWKDVQFMTSFQFLRKFCKWKQEDCKEAATERAVRFCRELREVIEAVSKDPDDSQEAIEEVSEDSDGSQHRYQLEMVKGSLREAFDSETLPHHVRGIMHEIETYMKVKLLMYTLRGRKWSVREEAAEALGKLGDKVAVPALQKVLQDSHWDVRRKAAEALGRLGDKAAVPALQATLKDPVGDVRIKTAEALWVLGDKAPLQAALEDSSWPVRRYSAEALGKLGDQVAVPALKTALKDKNDSVRVKAAVALWNFGDKAPLQAALAGKDSEVRIDAARALGKLGGEAAVTALQAALTDRQWDLRLKAAESLWNLEEKAPLRAALHDSAWKVRMIAAEDLGTLGDKTAVPALQAALKDKSEYVRQTAAQALGKLGDEAAVPALQVALKDRVWDVRLKAAEALWNLQDKAPLRAALQDSAWKVRTNAAEALGRLGDKAAVPALQSALKDKSGCVRQQSSKALGKLGDEAAVPALQAALKDRVWDVRLKAAEALWNLEDKAPLRAALQDSASKVRMNAAKALGTLGDKAAVPALHAALKDKREHVRQTAAEALGKLGDTSAVPALQAALQHFCSWQSSD